MPFAPSTTDQRGQIWSQGIGQFAQGVARGIEDYGRRQEENKALTSQAKALETLLPVYAKNAGVAPEEIEQFLAPSPDETPRGRVARLSSAIEGIVGNAALKSRQLQDAQIQQAMLMSQTQQAGEQQRQAALAQSLQQQAELNAMIDRSLAQSRTRGVLRPDVQDQAARTVASPAGQMRAMGAQVTPEMIAEFIRTDMAHRPQPKLEKPIPGSAGFKTIDVPDLGTIVLDQATGEPLEGSKVIKREVKPAVKPTEAEVSFDTNVDEGLAKIAEFRDVVKKFGNWEIGGPMGNPKARAALEQIPYQLAIMHAKIADPNSVAREGEVAAAQKYMLPSGFLTSNAMTLASLDGLENTFKGYAAARRKARGETPTSGAGGGKASSPAAGPGQFAGPDGVMRPIVSVRGQRGVVADGKFYPIVE